MSLRWLLPALVIAALFLAACGDDGPPDAADECEPGGLGGPGCSQTPTRGTSPTAPSLGCEGVVDLLDAPTVTFNGGSTSAALLYVEVADSPEERSTGLARRECLAEDSGVLFVFPRDVQSQFTMAQTTIPLSIAWIAEDGTILEIEAMEPLATELYAPPSPYRYTIEANQGWFEENGVEAGDRADVSRALAE